jgi:peptide/nickel transport system permease protein
MLRPILQRLGSAAVTLFLGSVLLFVVLEVLPGDPAAVMLGLEARPDTLAAVRAELGLDQPALPRYLAWVGGMLQGDFGLSYTYRVPVADLIAERLSLTLPLALFAILISTALALPLGTLAAAKHGKAADAGVMLFAQLGVAVPNFWIGLLLILLFSLTWPLFPVGSFPGWGDGLLPGLRALFLPALALALPQAAILARVTRAAVLEVLGEDYIRTARAKGVSETRILIRHALRAALVPVVTILGLQFSFLVAGAILVENIFALPGLGRLLYQAMNQRDVIVVKDVAMLLAAFVILVNLLVDLAYLWLDPRLRRGA